MALIKCPECKKKISDQCENCPQCGYPIKNILQDENPNNENDEIIASAVNAKKPLYKRIWVWVVAGIVLVSLILGAILLLNSDTKPKLDKEGNPVFVELTNEVYTNAKKYKGYHVNIKGKVFQVMSDNGNVKGIQIWLDPDTCEQNLMIYYNTDAEVKQDDYIVCSGYIDSVTEYKNAYNAKLYAPLVISSDLKKSTYMEVMSPATATITPENLKQEKYGYSVSINKVEFTEKETRIYITAINNGKATLNLGGFVIVQDGKQYNSETNYDADYEEIPYEIVKGVSCSGIMAFPSIKVSDFELTIDIYSDDYDEEFVFKVSKDGVVVEKPIESKPTPTITPTVSRKEQAAKVALNNVNDTTTPNDIKSLLLDNGFSSDEINYAVYGGRINWQEYIPSFVYNLNFETEATTITKCIRCNKRYYGEYNSCQYLGCGGAVNSVSYYGYSRADTISRLLDAGYLQADVEIAMKNYEYGEFIDENDFSDCIVVSGKLCEHCWNPPTCQSLSTCTYCGETRGNYANHEYSQYKCIYCGKELPWTPPKISCSSWVSLKELQEKAGYYIDDTGKEIIIKDLNDDRAIFILGGLSGGLCGEIRELDYNGVKVHYRVDSDSDYAYQNTKLQYTDLVTIGVLA